MKNVDAETLMNQIKKKTLKGSVFYTDTWKSYNSLEQYGKHNKINHQEEFVKNEKNHINGIEGFWKSARS